MNSFKVKTPDEWKNRLFEKTSQKKLLRIKPLAIIAAILAVIICISGSSLAVRITKAPEYFGSTYLGTDEISNEVYSEKNYIFDSSRDDLVLKCKGIAGDNFSMTIVFELTSTGELLFDKNKIYRFFETDQIVPFSSSWGRSIACYVINERTLEINFGLSDINVSRIAGKNIVMYFKNIETFDKTEFIECEFSGRIVIDYHNTLNKLKVINNTFSAAGITFKPIKGEISNFNFDFYLEAVDGKEIFKSLILFEDKMLPDTLTLHYTDGTSEKFIIKMPPENENEIFPGVMGARDNYKLHLMLHFRKPIKAADVISVDLNETELFVKA